MTEFKIGQKWISNAEPELAMGRIIRLEARLVSVFFDIAQEERTYARNNAPLSRVKFGPGDKVATQDGIVIHITSVVERDNILIYHGDYQGTNTAVIETELDPNVKFSKPEDRLFTGQFDDNRWFNLRYETWQQLSRQSSNPARGLHGPRIGLIPHQLYIANEVANRFAPRVLLADEVGLGKTIEAGLIVHQQLHIGRAKRVLIIVPPALTFQWFVELIRRFNLQFTVLDEERCQNIMADNAEEALSEDDIVEAFNPFEAQQLMLCNLDLFTDNPSRLEQALEAEWDLLVVDEAHHLRWTEDDPSIEYTVVDLLAKVSKGLLLLTATPEQLGKSGHFARLRLLDPHRFHSYKAFLHEETQFGILVEQANDLLLGDEAEKSAARHSITEMVQTSGSDDELIRALLDRHGTGRVLFRNVRSAIEGFPARLALPIALEKPANYAANSLYPEQEIEGWTKTDPRIDWLEKFLLQFPDRKILLICRLQTTAVEIEKNLSERIPVRTTVFHEGMDLIARDRAANYFAETERGAQLMVCSEIGSEGRNFQFASDLILFDLPLSPDLLEQRIGRLDRIGQVNDVRIHIPYFIDTKMQQLFRLYDEALQLFSKPNPVAQGIFDEFAHRLDDLDQALISEVRALNKERLENLNQGRDRLLELNSHDRQTSARIVNDIQRLELDPALEAYMEQSFDQYGLESEELGDKVLRIKPTVGMQRNDSVSVETQGHFHYPELPEEGIRITYDRDTALSREDVSFFSWENPTVQQALDVAISDVTGNSTMIAVKHPRLKSGTLLVETLSIVDCTAPEALMVDRYLPPRVIRTLITASLKDIAALFPFTRFDDEIIDIPIETFKQILDSQVEGIKKMLVAGHDVAIAELTQLKATALDAMQQQMNVELDRMKELKRVNENVRDDEIGYLLRTQEDLARVIDQAGIRTDAVRIIVAA